MKKVLAAALALCLLLTACGGRSGAPADSVTACTPAQIAWAVWAGQEETPEESEALTPEDPGFDSYLSTYYRLDPETVEDGYLRCAGGMDAFELAVLRFREDADMDAAEAALLAYREARAGDFTGYLPEQAALAEAGTAAVQGHWAALLLCSRPEKALEDFLACFGAGAPPPQEPDWPASRQAPPEEASPAPETPEVPEGPLPAPEEPAPVPPETGASQPEPPPAPPIPDVYDGAAVRSAWASGDTAGLSEKSLAVLNAAGDVLRQIITEDMSGYDKELAIHDWMLDWGRYDHDALSHLEGDEGSPDNENPYGFLIQQKGICLGYASTFQLFMDLLGIECLTVEGTAHGGTSAHAWNLVRLEGDWYGVDVTWDDPSGVLSQAQAHRYFNVTSQFLRSCDHQWTADVPEAEGTALAWSQPELSLPGA